MKLQRLIAILTALLQKERISAVWFAEKFGVSIRTIYRDIKALESAGIPIITHTGINGGISIIDGYKIDKKLFTNQDIATLLTSLYSVSSSISDTQINQTLEKIKSLIPQEYNQSIELKSKQLFIDMKPWSNSPATVESLHTIQKALENNELIRFDYAKRHTESSNRITEPHQLVLKESNWYLRAYCRQRMDFRIFKISRMKNIEHLSEHFEPREFENELTDFKDWSHEKIITVQLIVDESLRERALEYCREENMQTLDHGKIGISLPFVESDLGYGVLLSMGHNCTVISPPHVRDELIRRIQLLRDHYT